MNRLYNHLLIPISKLQIRWLPILRLNLATYDKVVDREQGLIAALIIEE